jgi:hypothetical protein
MGRWVLVAGEGGVYRRWEFQGRRCGVRQRRRAGTTALVLS